jgi:hypothetical protein
MVTMRECGVKTGRMRLSIGVRALALTALATLATACGEGQPDGGAGEKPTTTPGTSSAAVDSGTVFDTEQKLRMALPPPEDMHGWRPVRASVNAAEQPEDASRCKAANWDCTAIASGEAQYEAFGETADFDLAAFANPKAAQDACRREAAWSAKYTKAQLPAAVVNVASRHAYYRNHGGLDGIVHVMCIGTVVATVRLEGDSNDPKSLVIVGDTFAERIQKVAA